MTEVRALGKGDRFGGPGGFNFRGIDATVNAVGPVFRGLGIVGPVPTLMDLEHEVVTTSKGAQMNRVKVRVKYEFIGPDGDRLSCLVPGEAFDSGDKATAKAMSVAMRIGLLQTLCLPTQEPDPDSFVEGLSELDHAREALVAKMKAVGADPNKVLAVYAGLYEGADPRTDTDLKRITEFTARLSSKDD